MTPPPALRRHRKAPPATAAVAIAFTVAACSGGAAEAPPSGRVAGPASPASSASSAARPGEPSATPTSSRPWTPSVDADEAACRKKNPKPWRPTNEPYAGPGPHYIHVIHVQLDPDEPEHAMDDRDLSALPDALVIPPERIPDGWRLIACVYDGRPTRRAGTITCTFSHGKPTKRFPLYESRYDVIVREARTGKKVTAFSVPGTTTKRCPTVVVDTGRTIILERLDGRALGKRLHPHFTATVDGGAGRSTADPSGHRTRTARG